MHPEGFHQVMGVLGFLGVELLGPFAEGGDYVLSVAFAELDAGAVAREVGAFLEQVQQLGDRFAVYLHGRHELAAFVGDAVHATELMVAAGVPHVVLHVSDDDVLPVGHVHGAVAADLEIGWAEVAVFR